MKYFFFATSALFAAAHAHASFDLMYVLDGTTRSVHRVDPINGVSLGRFGGGFLNNPIAMSLDASNNVWVLDRVTGGAGRIRKFDGSTGDYLGGWATPYGIGVDAKIKVTATNVFTTGGLNYTFGFVFNYTLAGAQVDAGYLEGNITSGFSQGVSTLGSNVYWSGYQTAGGAHKLFRAPIGTTWTGSVYNASATVAGGASAANLISHNGKLIFNPTNSTSYVYDSNLNLNSSVSMSGFTSIRGLASGHEDIVHVAGMTSTGFGVAKYYVGTNDYIGPTVISGTGITDVRDIAVLVAPEPTSFVAMGLGLAALAKRRKVNKAA